MACASAHLLPPLTRTRRTRRTRRSVHVCRAERIVRPDERRVLPCRPTGRTASRRDAPDRIASCGDAIGTQRCGAVRCGAVCGAHRRRRSPSSTRTAAQVLTARAARAARAPVRTTRDGTAGSALATAAESARVRHAMRTGELRAVQPEGRQPCPCVSTPVSTPLSTPVSTPLSTPVSTPLSTPVSTLQSLRSEGNRAPNAEGMNRVYARDTGHECMLHLAAAPAKGLGIVCVCE
jgi:hypothetical protein